MDFTNTFLMFQNLQQQINALAQGGTVPPEIIAQINGNSSNIGVLQTDVGTLNTEVSGNTSNITALNTSVGTLSGNVATNTSNITTLQGQVTALENLPCGQWHKSSNQTITTTGLPSTVSITWNSSSAWTNTSLISHNGAGSANYTVNTRGIYRINLQVLYNNLSSATFTDNTLRIYINLTRGSNTNFISQANFDFTNITPNNSGVNTGLLFELQVGDVISFQTSQFLSLGSFTITGQTAAPSDWDLNTFWSWELVRLL